MYLKLGLRDIRMRPGRSLLTLASVVIAVAGLVAVSFSTQTTDRAFDAIYQTIAGRAALQITAPIGEPFSESILSKVTEVSGVQAAVPLLQRPTILYFGDKDTQVMAMGIDPKLDPGVHDYEIVEGKSLVEANGVLLNVDLARNLKIKVGDRVELLTPRNAMKTNVVGLYKVQGAVASGGHSTVILLPLRAAQYLYKAPKSLDAIQIALEEGANESEIQSSIEKMLDDNRLLQFDEAKENADEAQKQLADAKTQADKDRARTDVERWQAEIDKWKPENKRKLLVSAPVERSGMAEETSLSTEQGLHMARGFSIIVAVFIIANTFLISVTQQRRQFGIMRAIGATRGQIAQLVFRKALVLGLVGTLLGCLLGYFAASYLNMAMGSLYQTPLPKIQLTAGPFIWAAVFGLGISILGAMIPAWKAGHLSPMEAIRDVLPAAMEGVSRWFVVLGVFIIAVSTILLVLAATGLLVAESAVWSSVTLIIGIVFLLPLGLKPLSQLAALALHKWMPVESRLACRQLLRHQSRTTLTVGVIFIAISTGIGLANSLIDNVNNVRGWADKTIIADYFVRAMAPDMATGRAADMPVALDAEIRKVPGIKAIDAVNLVVTNIAGEQVLLIIRHFDNAELQEFELVKGDKETVRKSLQEGKVVIGSVLAERAKLQLGGKVQLESFNGVEFEIAGVANDYQAGGLTMYMDSDVAKRLMSIDSVNTYVVNAQPGKSEEVERNLKSLADKYGVLLQSSHDIQTKIDRMIAGVVACLWGLVVLALVVAAFGVTNTLMMTVLEQTREFGLLRVIAMNRWQLRKTILAQALVMGLLALVPGIAAGVAVAYLIHLATLSVIGHPVEFVVHPWLLASAFLAGLIVILVAAWIPAERASRLHLTDAMRNE